MPKIVDHEERRNQIAAAAAQVIAERGVDDVTMVAIAEAAGMTTGAVTHYFSDKDAVILAALRWADDAMQVRVARAFEKHDDLVSIVLEALPTNTASRLEWLVWAVFSDRATRSKALMAETEARDEAWHEFAVQVLTKMQQEGAVDPCIDVQLEAKVAVALIDGIGFDAAFNPKRWSEDEQRKVVQYYIERLAPRPR